MSAPSKRRPGPAAIAAKGWLRAHRWLLLRRSAQLAFLALFLSGPLAGVWITRGTLASSETLDVLPLTDPLILLQALLAGHAPEATALLGAALVLGAYALLRGRLYCSWVCPVNLVTDAAAALRRRLGLKEGTALNRRLRLHLLAAVLLASAVTGVVAWEAVNPVTLLHRALVFGTLFAGGLAWAVVAAIFLFDLAVAPRGWCGHLCPVGAFYGQLGRFGRLAVAAPRRAACDHCMDCFQVCPEPHVIAPALNPALDGPGGGVILSPDCTACGRCADVCPHDVFALALRLPHGPAAGAQPLRQGDPT
ncbi:quinol dehydrogenase ferredoxin subunit NapH [Azospirillum sp. ST 5-10]|uniref:quinol dehydrogenase ferredoxin subunit NapH n=1 Tax=unclassified Azospirillum TaxID=2630922 RepID=UPI003F49B7C9